jgi:hypothetical protein
VTSLRLMRRSCRPCPVMFFFTFVLLVTFCLYYISKRKQKSSLSPVF